MSVRQNFKRTSWPLIVLALILAACTSPTAMGEPQAWIDFPRDGATIPPESPVTIVSHAYNPAGVSEVLLSVDGAAYRRDRPASPGDSLVEVRQEWFATEPGLHTIEVRAYDADGEVCGSDSITVRVTGDEVELPTETPSPTKTTPPTQTATPTVTPTPTVTHLPPPEVNFWADDDSITAGECTTLNWEVSWATLVTVNDTEVAETGTWSVCPESTTTYTLLAEGPGGSAEEDITILVSEPSDTTPPPVPTPYVPANGLALSCRSKQSLVWLPVEDPSGVVYYVKLERKINDTTWETVRDWGPISEKQIEVDVDCGIIYRWAVRAQDGAGNTSAWSEWFTFSVDLT